jgi:hypothetical protein
MRSFRLRGRSLASSTAISRPAATARAATASTPPPSRASTRYSENVRWACGPVVFLGLNVQGSNDNYPYHDTDGPPLRDDVEIQRQRNEEIARKAANLHWLSEGFQYAKQIGAKGVLIDWQADPNFNDEQHAANPHDFDAYPAYVDALRNESLNFSGQVALVHGDSHYFKVDKPLKLGSGKVPANFTRVETFGAARSARREPSRRAGLFLNPPRLWRKSVAVHSESFARLDPRDQPVPDPDRLLAADAEHRGRVAKAPVSLSPPGPRELEDEHARAAAHADELYRGAGHPEEASGNRLAPDLWLRALRAPFDLRIEHARPSGQESDQLGQPSPAFAAEERAPLGRLEDRSLLPERPAGDEAERAAGEGITERRRKRLVVDPG